MLNIATKSKKKIMFINQMLMLQRNLAECEQGYYGRECTGRCSVNCYITSRCDRFTGFCTGGCKLGWTGNTCVQRNILTQSLKEC